MHSLTTKLILAFLVVSLAGVGMVAGIVGFSTARQFDQFLVDRAQNEFASLAENYYLTYGSWSDFERAYQDDSKRLGPHANNNRDLLPVALADERNRIVVGGGKYHIGDTASEKELSQGVALYANGQRIGTALKTGTQPTRDPLEQSYLSTTTRALIYAALGAGLLALVLGTVLARTITSPVRELTSAVHAMAKGQLKQQVQVRSKDEIGELTSTFNQMSTDLQHANDIRRQMTADIAHDLRTPLTVISGYIESLRDGVLKPTPERFDILYTETRQLQRLVDDLRTLSLADAGELTIMRQVIDPGELLSATAAAFQHQAEQRGIQIQMADSQAAAQVQVDPERMAQVLGNLLSNALRYTPDGGSIRLAAQNSGGSVILTVQDNGAGIPENILEHIFDRFYRGDESRQSGASGLGLAIARAIVELHGGTISAANSGSGAVFSIRLPAYL